MTHPRWIVPLEPGEITEESPALIVDISQGLQVVIAARWSNADTLPIAIPSLAACQLGQALQDASKYVGQTRAKADARRRR